MLGKKKEEEKPLHPFTQPLIQDFEDVFLLIYPRDCLHLEVLSTKLIYYPGLPYQINQLIDVIPLKLRNSKGKFKNSVIGDTLGKAQIHVLSCYKEGWNHKDVYR